MIFLQALRRERLRRAATPTSFACAVALLGVSCVTTVSAQTALDPVVVTGTREPERLDRISGDIVVIDAQRIRESTADSLEDLLRREAGLQVSRSGGPGQNASVFIRGAGSGNTVVLIDGVRVGSATLGQVEFESLGLQQIERIEVLRGPGSSLYGADAVGGVIQIFTRRGEGAARFTANGAIGGYHSREGSVGVSGSSGAFDYAAGLGRESSRGVSALKPGDQFGNFNPDDDGYKRDSGQLKLGYTPVTGHRIGLNIVASRLNAQYDASEFAPPTFAQDPTPDFRNRLRSEVAALEYRGVVNGMWTTSAQISRNNDDLESGGNIIDRFRTERDQFTWQNALKFSTDQQVVLAYEYLNEKAESTSFDSEKERNNHALVVGYTGTFAGHLLQADLRHDRNSVYGNNTTGRLGWSMEIVPKLRVRAVAGTTFRAPSFNELYFPGFGVEPGRYDVPGIEPERGRSVELGLTWRSSETELAATVYRNRVKDLIVFEFDRTYPNCPSDPAFDFGCARNFGNARLQGATFSGSQRWGSWRISGTLDFLDAKNLDTGDRLPRRAAHQANFAVDYDLGAWNFGAALLAVGARPDGGVELASYETLDLRARWRFASQWQLEAKLLNATDRTIEPARDYQTPGRQAWIGVRYDSKGW